MILALLENLLARAFNRIADGLKSLRQARKLTKSKVGVVDDPAMPLRIGDTIPSARERMQSTPVELAPEIRKRGIFVAGQTGSGKSVFALNIATWDILNGNALINIDYRGESTDRLLAFLRSRFTPEQIAERLVLIDLRQRSTYGSPGEPAVGFNPLTEIAGDPHAAVAQFLDVLRQTWGEQALGVQLIDTLRHVLLSLTLSPSGPYTLLDIEPLLTDAAFRNRVLTGITDEPVLRFFQRFDALPDPATWVLPVLNKLSPLLATHRRLRETLGVHEGGVSFRTLLDEKPDAIVLICLAADETAKSVAGVVGSLLLSAAIRGVMRSDRALPSGDHGTHFLLDEFLNYAVACREPLDELVREGRKFGTMATLITQSPSLLDASMRALLTNVIGSTMLFSQGPGDADALAGMLHGDEPKTVLRTLLMNQKPGEALLLRQGLPMTRMRTRYKPTPTPSPDDVKALRRAVLKRWGALAVAVESTTQEAASESLEAPGFHAEEANFEVRDVPPPTTPPLPKKKKGGRK